jgi:hypothetical protein
MNRAEEIIQHWYAAFDKRPVDEVSLRRNDKGELEIWVRTTQSGWAFVETVAECNKRHGM